MAAISLADIAGIFQSNAPDAEFEQILFDFMTLVHNLLIILFERNNGNFNRRQMFFQLEDNTGIAAAKVFFFISFGQQGQDRTVNPH